MVLFAHVFSRCPSTFRKIANHCNVLICTTNQTIAPWTVIHVKPSINNKLCGIVKSGAFSTISASLELSSSIVDSVHIWQDKSTDNSAVYIMNYILWNMKNYLPAACIFQISLTIDSESTWPGLNAACRNWSLSGLKLKKNICFQDATICSYLSSVK